MKELRVVLFHEPMRGELCMTCEGCKGLALGGHPMIIGHNHFTADRICQHISDLVFGPEATDAAALFLRA